MQIGQMKIGTSFSVPTYLRSAAQALSSVVILMPIRILFGCAYLRKRGTAA
jgi:hypothetical protein